MTGPTRRARRLVGLVLALGSLPVVSACTAHPDTAATGGGVEISLREVDSTVDLVCDQAADRGDVAPRAALRQQVAALLASSELIREFARDRGLELPAGSVGAGPRDRGPEQRLAQIETLSVLVPDVLSRAAAQDLTRAGSPINLDDPTQQQVAVRLGQEAFGRWLGPRRVDFDPRLRLDGSSLRVATRESIAPVAFGSTDLGSVPISAAGLQVQGDPETLAGLPTNQVCGARARG